MRIYSSRLEADSERRAIRGKRAWTTAVFSAIAIVLFACRTALDRNTQIPAVAEKSIPAAREESQKNPPLPSPGSPTPLVPVPTEEGSPAAVPELGGCSIFPADNPWNSDISDAPVHPRSAAYIQSIGAGVNLHADFGSNPEYGIPFTIAPPGQARVPVEFVEYGDESDPGPYPIPPDAPVESGSDRHLLVLASGECRLYELYHAQRAGAGWQAGSGAVFDLASNALRPDGWTSADAAGLPILPGLARYDEIETGAIRHAMRVTVETTFRGYIHPATHFASDETDPRFPPMGLRLRLRADYDVSGYTGAARVILEALKRYGLIVADNGSDWFISGATDPRWDDEDLDQLKTVPGSAFEAVETGKILPQ